MKQMDEEYSYSGLTVGELRKAMEGFDDDVEIKMRTCHNPMGNIVEAGVADASSYGFFGKSIPCIIIEPSCIDYIIDPKIREARIKSYQENLEP